MSTQKRPIVTALGSGHMESAWDRRTLLKGAGAAAGAAALSWGRPLLTRAQDPGEWTRETRIISWGFNTEPTNPLAAARVEAFREAYPSIELEIVPEADQQKILTGAVSGTLPDLLWLDRFTIASFAARGRVLMPFDQFVEEDSYDLDRFYSAGIDESTFEGQLYGIPGGMDVQALYVNLDALEEAGITIDEVNTGDWEQLADLGEQLVQREGDVIRRWGFDHKIQDGFIYVWGEANDAEFMVDDGQTPNFSNPALADTLEWGKATFDQQGGFQSLESARTSWQGDEQFARGQVAMTMYQSWMLGIVSRTVPELNFRLLPLRPRNADDGMVSTVGGRSWCISENANDPEAAWEFIKFMHTDETWLIGAEAVRQARDEAGQPYIPSLTGSRTADLAQIEEVYEPLEGPFDEAVRLFPEILDQASVRPIANSPVSNELDSVLNDTAVLPSLRGERPVEEALDAAQREAEDAVTQFF